MAIARIQTCVRSHSFALFKVYRCALHFVTHRNGYTHDRDAGTGVREEHCRFHQCDFLRGA